MEQNSEIFQRFGENSTEPMVATENDIPHTAEHTTQSINKTGDKVQGRFIGALKEIFGQFFTAAFWKDAAKVIVQEMFHTFLISFGNSLTFIGRKGRDERVVNASPSIPPGISDRAFSNRSVSTVSTAPATSPMSRFGFR